MMKKKNSLRIIIARV
jgi:hypothetical protein